MKRLLKLLLLVNVLSIQIVFAHTVSQEALDKATMYYEKQDYKEALKWAKTSFEAKKSKAVAFNIGLAYKKLEDYDNAIKWYEKSFEMGYPGGGLNVALLYEKKFNNIAKAITWYKKGIEKGQLGSYDNISLIYHNIKKDNLTASAYYIATIDKSYSKKDILDFLKKDWNIDEATIKEAYELQKTLVPNPYTGGIE